MSGGFGEQRSVAPTRGEELEKVVSRVRGVCSDLSCPFPDSGCVQVLDGGQVGTDDLSCRPDCPLESVLIQFGGRSKPDSYGCAQNRLDDCSVKQDQQLLRQVVLPKLAQEVQPLLGLLENFIDVGFPLQVPGDCGSQKPE